MTKQRQILVLVIACCSFAAAEAECAQTPASEGGRYQSARGAGLEGQAERRDGNAAGFRIAGVVVDAVTGAAVGNAELSIAEEGAEVEAGADEEGRFAFEGVEAGKYALTAKAPGYVTEMYKQHGAFATAVAVGEGLDSEHIVFRLQRQTVITGTVTDEHGEAVRNAQVMLFVEDRRGGKKTVRMAAQRQTDDLGAYRFAHLDAGKYFVAVSATRPWYAQATMMPPQMEGNLSASGGDGVQVAYGHGSPSVAPKGVPLDVVYPTTFYPGVTDEHLAGELVVSAGEVQQADLRLQAVPATHLLVTGLPTSGKTNEPGPGIGIGVTQKVFETLSGGLPMASTPVGPGVYEVIGLPPGEVTLTLNENRNGQWENRTIHANARDGESVDAAAVGATVNVTGRVVPANASGGGLEGTVLLSGGEGQTFSRNLQKDGTFTILGVQPGTYEVQVNLGASGRPEDYVEGVAATGAKADGEQVKLEGGQDAQLVIRMGRGMGQVKGVVKEEGKPQAGAMVLLVPASGEKLERYARIDQSDSDGTFTLGNVVPGKYVLMAIADGWDLEWENEGVLRPYREKGQAVEVRAYEVKKVDVEEQRRAVGSDEKSETRESKFRRESLTQRSREREEVQSEAHEQKM